MLASVLNAKYVTTTVKHTSTTRISCRNLWSEIRGRNGRRTFSLKLTEGARSVALAQLLIAESSAPKNMICAKSGTMGERMRGGRRGGDSWWGCPSPFFGSRSTAEWARNRGKKAKKKYTPPPMIAERAAVFSSLADCTRWKTSCWGIDP